MTKRNNMMNDRQQDLKEQEHFFCKGQVKETRKGGEEINYKYVLLFLW